MNFNHRRLNFFKYFNVLATFDWAILKNFAIIRDIRVVFEEFIKVIMSIIKVSFFKESI